MNIWLVQGKVKISRYMSSSEISEVTRLVKADTAEVAREKFVQHFESKSSSYGTNYFVLEADVLETIE